MSLTTDWRSRTAGNISAAPGRPEFAAEFLRRNSRYQSDYARMIRRIATGSANEAACRIAFARKWGLSFRLRPV